jgi:hypothetical protein
MKIAKIILAVLGAGLLVSRLAWADDIGPPLSTTEIMQMIVEHLVERITPNGHSFKGIYNPDGSFVDADGTTGTWRIDGSNFCSRALGSTEVCGTLHKLGVRKFQFIRVDGKKSFVILVKRSP